MRKLLLACLFCLFLPVLNAQTWELPDVEVPVESPIKAYIYKKPVVYRADSLRLSPSFLPLLNPTFVKGEIPLYIPPLHYVASTSLNTRAENSSHFAFYPYRQWPKRVDLRFDWQPRRDLHSNFRVGLKGFYQLDENLIEIFGEHYNGEWQDFWSALNHLGIEHTNPGNKIWSGLRTKLALAFLNQTDITEFKSGNTYEFQHSAQVHLAGQTLGYNLLLEHSQTALLLDFALPVPQLSELSPSLSLLSDLKRVFPSLGLNYQLPIAPNHSIFLSQTASLESNSYSKHLDINPWQNLMHKPHMTLKPLNLTADWEYSPDPLVQPVLRISRLELSSSYATGQGFYTEQALSPLPKLEFTDEFATALKLKAELEDRGYKLLQEISLNLVHQKARNWQRAAYSPLLELHSTVTRNWDKYAFSLSLEQRYNQQDHSNQQLKDTIDLSLQTSWNICRDWQLQMKLNRIFNSKLITYNSLPPEGRELWLGITYYGR